MKHIAYFCDVIVESSKCKQSDVKDFLCTRILLKFMIIVLGETQFDTYDYRNYEMKKQVWGMHHTKHKTSTGEAVATETDSIVCCTDLLTG